MLGFIITLIVVGLIAGALARLIIPGRQNLSIPMTILLGSIGSFVGGFLANLMVKPVSEKHHEPKTETEPEHAGPHLGHRVVDILAKRRADLTPDDVEVMEQVVTIVDRERGPDHQ